MEIARHNWIFWCKTWIGIIWWREGLSCPMAAEERWLELVIGRTVGGIVTLQFRELRPRPTGLPWEYCAIYERKRDENTLVWQNILCYWTSTISWMSKNWTRLWSYVEFYKDKSGMLNTMRIIKRRTGRRSARYRRFKRRFCRQGPKV